MSVARVVSLTCSNTEIVAALGCAERLVGVDDYSDFPPEVVADLPRVGPDLGIDVSAVAALEPDLVLASLTVPGHEAVVDRVARRGLRHIAPAPQGLAGVYSSILEIGSLLGVVERAASVVGEMKAALRPAELRREPPKIAVQWWPKPPILPGGTSWVNDLIDLAGGRNPIGAEPVDSRPLTIEELAALDPDAIVLSWCGVDDAKIDSRVVTENPVLRGVRAVEDGRVVTISEAYLGRPSPRLVDGYRALRALVDSIATAPLV